MGMRGYRQPRPQLGEFQLPPCSQSWPVLVWKTRALPNPAGLGPPRGEGTKLPEARSRPGWSLDSKVVGAPPQ